MVSVLQYFYALPEHCISDHSFHTIPIRCCSNQTIDMESNQSLVPVNIVFDGMLITSMFSLKYINVAMLTILKNVANVPDCFWGNLFFQEAAWHTSLDCYFRCWNRSLQCPHKHRENSLGVLFGLLAGVPLHQPSCSGQDLYSVEGKELDRCT